MLIAGRVVIYLIKGYRYFISPLTPPHCRFQPTCSEYALIAIHRFGVVKGVGLTLKRLLQCAPGGGGGQDPVPGVKSHP